MRAVRSSVCRCATIAVRSCARCWKASRTDCGDSLELLRALGVQPEVGRVSGGGARSALWREIVASVLDLPLETTAVEEGSAYGAALLAGCRAGTFVDPAEAVAHCVRVRERTEPNAEWASTYATEYERFRRLYPALR
jgi:sugar (pentulose or hexulose) kinase